MIRKAIVGMVAAAFVLLSGAPALATPGDTYSQACVDFHDGRGYVPYVIEDSDEFSTLDWKPFPNTVNGCASYNTSTPTTPEDPTPCQTVNVLATPEYVTVASNLAAVRADYREALTRWGKTLDRVNRLDAKVDAKNATIADLRFQVKHKQGIIDALRKRLRSLQG